MTTDGGFDIEEVGAYVDPDTVNTNHRFKLCVLPHVESRTDRHCYVCGGDEDNGRHTAPYGGAVD